MNSTTVVIEDEKDMCQFLADVLADHGHTTFTATTGVDGLALVEKVNPDLVLLDIDLPDLDGRSICKQISEDYPEIKVIIITGHDSPTDEAHGLQLGADDYITKPIDTQVLLARIAARFRQDTSQAEVLSFNNLSLNVDTHDVSRNNQSIDLSPQEFRLLHYFMQNPKRVLSREMILSRIWEGNPDVETRVVDVYVGYLRKKIDTQEPKLIHSVRGFGYVLKE